MAEQLLSVRWQNHNSELATEYGSLLENNFLVDCTLSAEGQRLKAHRLVLSACSPYFQMLFHEEAEKHPFVVLLNTSFETLKAVIDFVYQGETHIPEGNLKAFLTLARSLKIKGLESQHYVNKNGSGKTGRHAPSSSEDNQATCEVFQENDPENYIESHVTCEEVQLLSDITPSQEDHVLVDYSEVSEVLEVTVKDEPLFSELLETRKKRLDSVNSNKTVCKTDGSTSVKFGKQDINQFSSGSKISLGNVELPLQQQPTQLNTEPSDRDVDVRFQLVVPEFLDLKSEQRGDSGNEELQSDHDMPGNDINETDEETEPALAEESLQRSSADGLPLEEDVATQRRSLPGQQSTSSPPHTELQLHEGRRAHPGQQTVLGDEGAMDLAHPPNSNTRRLGHGRKRHCCGVCLKRFPTPSELARHERTHTGEKPYLCNVCGKGFTLSGNLKTHMRIHTGDRPFRCDTCGKGFTQLGHLNTHMRSHTGERAFRSDTCCKVFTRLSTLVDNMHPHTGERTFRCDEYGVKFRDKSSLSFHKRKHVQQRP